MCPISDFRTVIITLLLNYLNINDPVSQILLDYCRQFVLKFDTAAKLLTSTSLAEFHAIIAHLQSIVVTTAAQARVVAHYVALGH